MQFLSDVLKLERNKAYAILSDVSLDALLEALSGISKSSWILSSDPLHSLTANSVVVGEIGKYSFFLEPNAALYFTAYDLLVKLSSAASCNVFSVRCDPRRSITFFHASRGELKCLFIAGDHLDQSFVLGNSLTDTSLNELSSLTDEAILNALRAAGVYLTKHDWELGVEKSMHLRWEFNWEVIMAMTGSIRKAVGIFAEAHSTEEEIQIQIGSGLRLATDEEIARFSKDP